jgi:hypothetical protein
MTQSFVIVGSNNVCTTVSGTCRKEGLVVKQAHKFFFETSSPTTFLCLLHKYISSKVSVRLGIPHPNISCSWAHLAPTVANRSLSYAKKKRPTPIMPMMSYAASCSCIAQMVCVERRRKQGSQVGLASKYSPPIKNPRISSSLQVPNILLLIVGQTVQNNDAQNHH